MTLTSASKSQLTAAVALMVTFAINGMQSCDVSTEYRCTNSNCIPLKHVNNSINDCGDNSDEVARPCRAPMFSCLSGRCILKDWVLNGVDECLDQSDEVKLVGTRCNVTGSCCPCSDYVTHSDCVDGFCRCNRGYYSNDAGTQCFPRVLGSPCTSTSQCRQVSVSSLCSTKGLCVCASPLEPSDGGRTCVSRPQTVDIAVVTVGVFLICVLIIVDVFLVVWLLKAYVCLDAGRQPATSVRQLVDVLAGQPSTRSRDHVDFTA